MIKNLILKKFLINHEKIIIENSKNSLSYSYVYLKIKYLKLEFEQLGLTKGNIIAIKSENILNIMVTFYTTQLLGLVFVPLDNNYSRYTLDVILEDLKPDLFIVNSSSNYNNINIFEEEKIKSCNDFNFSDLNQKDIEINDNDMAVILYSSGTTGNPKGVMLSNKSIYKSAKLVAKNYNISNNDIILNLAPVHTMSGLRNTLLVPLFSQSRIIDFKKIDNFINILELIYRHKVTILLTSPLIIKQLNFFFKKIDLQKLLSLRFLMSTGNVLEKEVISEFENHFNIPLYNYYGLTESSGICIGFTPRDKEVDNSYLGFAMGCEIDIVDENNSSLGYNKVGRLKINGNNMLGYYKNEKLTNTTIQKKWLYTQDLVLMNELNCIKLIGRIDDAFNNEYTELIYPSEIENIINMNDNIFESSVFEYKSTLGISKIGAYVVLNEKVEDESAFLNQLRDFVYNRLGNGKTPSKIFTVNTFPKGNYDKINRKKIKEIVQDDIRLR